MAGFCPALRIEPMRAQQRQMTHMKMTTFWMPDGCGYIVRTAKTTDAAAIASHRERLFIEHGYRSDATLAAMSAAFTVWVHKRLLDTSYAGWLGEFDGRIVAGIGFLFFADPAPHPSQFNPVRGYLMNAYTHPAHRRTGIAERLTQIATEHAGNLPNGYGAPSAPVEALRHESLAFAGVAEVPRAASAFDRGAGIAQPAADDVAEPSPGMNPKVRVPDWLDAMMRKTL
jgi:ribosomal protein S18 acetylase RimI-like enzyme